MAKSGAVTWPVHPRSTFPEDSCSYLWREPRTQGADFAADRAAPVVSSPPGSPRASFPGFSGFRIRRRRNAPLPPLRGNWTSLSWALPGLPLPPWDAWATAALSTPEASAAAGLTAVPIAPGSNARRSSTDGRDSHQVVNV